VAKYRSKKRNKVSSISYSKKSKWFRIISILIGFTFFVSHLLTDFSADLKHFEDRSIIFCLLIGAWFYVEDEMFRFKKFYLKSFIVAAGIVVYGYFLLNFVNEQLSQSAFIYFFCPLVFLIIQWPLRRLFKLMFQREPVVLAHGNSNVKFADVVYSFTLLFALIILPFLIDDYINL